MIRWISMSFSCASRSEESAASPVEPADPLEEVTEEAAVVTLDAAPDAPDTPDARLDGAKVDPATEALAASPIDVATPAAASTRAGPYWRAIGASCGNPIAVAAAASTGPPIFDRTSRASGFWSTASAIPACGKNCFATFTTEPIEPRIPLLFEVDFVAEEDPAALDVPDVFAPDVPPFSSFIFASTSLSHLPLR